MIFQNYLYKVEAVENLHIDLHVAKIQSSFQFPPLPRSVLSGLLTGWRLLYSGLGYKELPLSREEARQLYFAAQSFERMSMLYASYCPHTEQVNPDLYLHARNHAIVAGWNLGRRSFRGGREWLKSPDNPAYGLMAVGHVNDYKTVSGDQTDKLLLDFTATSLSGAGLPAASISFTAGAASLVHFLRPGMVWEYTDEYECPHCLSNAAYEETYHQQQVELLPGLDQRREIDLRICRCSLCGKTWKEDLSVIQPTTPPAQET